jgi:hypothetical protein
MPCWFKQRRRLRPQRAELAIWDGKRAHKVAGLSGTVKCAEQPRARAANMTATFHQMATRPRPLRVDGLTGRQSTEAQ